MRIELPTLAYLTDIIHAEIRSTSPMDDDIDIRLVAGWVGSSHEGEWTVNVGSSDYDQWHGHCGASGYNPQSQRPSKSLAREIARELLDQVRDSFAQSEGN